MSKIVVALGGNALGKTAEEQLLITKKTAKRLVNLIEMGHQIIITHGNGPQVGEIYNAFAVDSKINGSDAMPFAECGAMSQGYIGYHLTQAIQNEVKKRNMRRKVIALVTEVEVDKNDPGFKNPSKPIGSFYNKKEALRLSKETNAIYKEDSGRGYRRVVPSPIPKSIVGISTIKDLIDEHTVLITCGGGGIPVVKTKYGYKGVDAVIDKDRTSSKLATLIDADILLILTTVEKVRLNFNKPNEISLDKMSVKEAKKYMNDGEFKAGSMLPKVEACIDFVSHGKGRKAIITSLSKAKEALEGKTGTLIYKED